MLVVLAWCCLREDFRIFRAERIMTVNNAGTSFRPRRVALLRTYLAQLVQPKRPPSPAKRSLPLTQKRLHPNE
jgi:predicted DNA-binding transcriptional regulator YafY